MSDQTASVCDFEDGIVDRVKKFKRRKEKTIAALIFKVKDSTIVLDEEYDDVSMEELQAELPSSQPRFILLSYVHKHDDGRVSYPFCLIYSSPVGGDNKLNVKYAGSKHAFEKKAEVTKCFQIRNVEDLTEEWLIEQLRFFR